MSFHFKTYLTELETEKHKHPCTFTQIHTPAQLCTEPLELTCLFSLHLLARICLHLGAPIEHQCFPKPHSKVREILIKVLQGGKESSIIEFVVLLRTNLNVACKARENHLSILCEPSQLFNNYISDLVVLSLSLSRCNNWFFV